MEMDKASMICYSFSIPQTSVKGIKFSAYFGKNFITNMIKVKGNLLSFEVFTPQHPECTNKKALSEEKALILNSATSYSPTPSPEQYHRRWKA